MALEHHEFGLPFPDTSSGGGTSRTEGQVPPGPAPESSREAARDYLLKFFTYNLYDWRADPPLEIANKETATKTYLGEEIKRLEALYPGVFEETLHEYDRIEEEYLRNRTAFVMRLQLTAAQQHAILCHLQAGQRKPLAPFPLSLIERALCALLDGVEVLARRFVGIMANLLRLPKPS